MYKQKYVTLVSLKTPTSYKQVYNIYQTKGIYVEKIL